MASRVISGFVCYGFKIISQEYLWRFFTRKKFVASFKRLRVQEIQVISDFSLGMFVLVFQDGDKPGFFPVPEEGDFIIAIASLASFRCSSFASRLGRDAT